MNWFKRVLIILLSLAVFSIPKSILAQESQTFEGKITDIIEEKQIDLEGQKQLYQKIELEGKIIVENGNQPLANVVKYKKGDKVIYTKEKDWEGNDFYMITDFVRRDSLLLLSIIFVALTLKIAKWKGLTSLLSMAFTFLILFVYVLPQISKGVSPLIVAAVASIIIIPISFYVAHGFSKKTTVAIVGSLIALLITAGLSSAFIIFGKLTGLSSEEAGMFLVDRQGQFNMQGLLLAGIVIGALGILDDITISQAAIVNELVKNSEKPNKLVIYKQAMNVGRDHISSMVNTLVLAYAGASLPLLLIFINNPHPFSEIINYEFLAEEIIRTLVGSIGLILAVPITTLIAVNWIKKDKYDLPKIFKK